MLFGGAAGTCTACGAGGDTGDGKLSKPVLLTVGDGWTLEARTEQRHASGFKARLCLNVMSRGEQIAGGCEFDGRPGGGYYTIGAGPRGSFLILGPVPSSVVRVRMSYPGRRDHFVATKPLPGLSGVRSGRYFIDKVDTDGEPTSTPVPGTTPQGFGVAGKAWSVTLLAEDGTAVPFVSY
ncbi:hypothetical protein EBO15_17960 [Actinomadura harenae]|uniref:Uncharacterized protein n=1 Tax=Actinomadura harenae TaxID=2483351 RepID=A0A3M2M210_9ACTN|nr:hypothetical protein EBO15_17960 [Actinomadura harenae]